MFQQHWEISYCIIRHLHCFSLVYLIFPVYFWLTLIISAHALYTSSTVYESLHHEFWFYNLLLSLFGKYIFEWHRSLFLADVMFFILTAMLGGAGFANMIMGEVCFLILQPFLNYDLITLIHCSSPTRRCGLILKSPLWLHAGNYFHNKGVIKWPIYWLCEENFSMNNE